MFIRSVVDRLVQRLAGAEPDEAPRAWCDPDSSWHTSSFELAQGLEVIEHHGAAPVPAETLSAFDAPARRAAEPMRA